MFIIFLERLRIINQNADRQKQRLNDELNDCKKRLRDQQKSNKETSDKYLRYKDFLNRTFKSHVRVLYDDYDDLLRRDSKQSSSSNHNSESSEAKSSSAKPSEKTNEKNESTAAENSSQEGGQENLEVEEYMNEIESKKTEPETIENQN